MSNLTSRVKRKLAMELAKRHCQAVTVMKSSIRIALIFLVAAVSWILLSDIILLRLVDDTEMMSNLQSIKGVMFVSVAALLIFYLTYREHLKQQKANAQLRQSEISFRGIFQAHPVPLFIQSMDSHVILAANQAAFNQYGYTEKEFLFLKTEQLLDVQENPDCLRQTSGNRSEKQKGPWKHRRKDGSIIFVETFTHPLDYKGTKACLIAAIDISGKVEAQAKANKALRELAFAEQNKSNILSAVSHELRSPLNAIMGLSQLLEADPKSEPVRDDIILIKDESEKLLELVNRLLAAGSIRLGERITRKTPMRVRDLWWDLYSRYDAVCQAKGLRLITTYDEKIPDWILLDESAIREICQNLLSNAIKFSNSGAVHLSFAKDGDDINHTLRIVVEDQGIGMDSANHERIFSAFVQLDGGHARHFSGCGIGLFVSRELAARLGGTITVQSEPGVGSGFTVTIPMHLPDEVTVEQGPTRPVIEQIHEE
jgi:PAS domain S-box-containing protein